MHCMVLCYSIMLTVVKYFDDKHLESILEWGTLPIYHQTRAEVRKQQFREEERT